MNKQETKLEPLQRMEIRAELELKTKYSPIYIKELSDEKLLKLLEENR